MSVDLNTDEKAGLLAIARNAISERNPQFTLPMVGLPEIYRTRAAVFVTLWKDGELRGCIGHVVPKWPLAEAVAHMACEAAYCDPRFAPVRDDEVTALRVEISILSTPERVSSIEEIRVGTDGLIVEADGRRGLLLPQVPTSRGWDAKTFLEQTCRKAGLPMDRAEDPGIEIFRFQADVFCEGET